MSKGIDADCTAIWKFLRSRSTWWTAQRLTWHWAPTFSLEEVEQHLQTLLQGGFVQCMGTSFAVTATCQALPGLEQAQGAEAPHFVAPRRNDVMNSTWRPAPAQPARAGAQDHARCPSLRAGQRVGFVPGYISK